MLNTEGREAEGGRGEKINRRRTHLRERSMISEPFQEDEYVETRIGYSNTGRKIYAVSDAVKGNQHFAVVFVGFVKAMHETLGVFRLRFLDLIFG